MIHERDRTWRFHLLQQFACLYVTIGYKQRSHSCNIPVDTFYVRLTLLSFVLSRYLVFSAPLVKQCSVLVPVSTLNKILFSECLFAFVCLDHCISTGSAHERAHKPVERRCAVNRLQWISWLRKRKERKKGVDYTANTGKEGFIFNAGLEDEGYFWLRCIYVHSLSFFIT